MVEGDNVRGMTSRKDWKDTLKYINKIIIPDELMIRYCEDILVIGGQYCDIYQHVVWGNPLWILHNICVTQAQRCPLKKKEKKGTKQELCANSNPNASPNEKQLNYLFTGCSELLKSRTVGKFGSLRQGHNCASLIKLAKKKKQQKELN